MKIHSENHRIFMLSVIMAFFYFRNVAQRILYIWHIVQNLKFVGISAYNALNNLKSLKKNQSILITGVTGSGKSENSKHIVGFLNYTESQNVNDVDPIFEAFGNARTAGNVNSSRFCKHMEVCNQYFSLSLSLFVPIHLINFIWCS